MSINAKMTAIADAIRAKTGGTAALTLDAMAEAIAGITGGYGDIPTYHYAESGRVIDLIRDFKKSHTNSLIFGAVSDIHVLNNDATYEARSKTAIRNAAFALETVGAMAECDFVAALGDNCWENGIDTENALIGAKYAINKLKPAFDRLTSFSLVGNHDKSDDSEAQYNLIGAHNDFDVAADTVIRGFGYKDFADKKVRVIALNTCDYLNASGGCAMSYEQKDFLLRSLDLSAKTDAQEWQILLLSHIPLDWNGGDYNYYSDLQIILGSYENGATARVPVYGSYALNETPSDYATYSTELAEVDSDGSLVYAYSGKNAAKLIANIHGHVHTNKIGKIANTDIARIATPNTNPDLNKSESYPTYGDYSISSEEAAKLVKVSGTAKDTSATFYCIDLDACAVYAFGYGADADRAVSYADADIYKVSYALTLCSSSNTASYAVGGTGYTTVITPAQGEIKSVTVTMGGADITDSCYSGGTVSIAQVTGDIVITAVAQVALISETVTPHIAPRSTWYNGLGGDGTLTLNSSNTEAALGVSAANAHAYTDRSGNTFYLMPIDAKYRKATLNYSATDGLDVRYYLRAVKESGGVFTSVAEVGKGTDNVITWTKGAADYLLVSIEHADGVTKWAWDSAGKTVTVTFSNQ